MSIVLEQHRDCTPQINYLEASNIPAIYEYISFDRVIDTGDESENGAFA
jgi:hypothetical protein